MKAILSILTPTIPGRESQLRALQQKIEAQSTGVVEHLVFCDNRMRSIGAKRQALVDAARGEYIAFCDDDDDISDDYVAELLKAAQYGAGVITFHQRAIYNGQESEVHFRLGQGDWQFMPGGITRRDAWHVCAWRRIAVAGCLFDESNYGEDLYWCRQARNRAKSSYHIPLVLHTYRHDKTTTAAPEPTT